MRSLVVLALLTPYACARTVPPATAAREDDRATEPVSDAADEPVVVVATPRSAQELIDEAGIATFREEQRLRISTADADAAERWFRRPPRSVYFYSEVPIEVSSETTVRGECQRLPRWDSTVLNEIDMVVWRGNRERALLELGFHDVKVVEQVLDEGEWRPAAAGAALMQTIAWDDDHIVYAEGATRYAVACVSAIRTVSCGDEPFRGASGHCVDRELLIRPYVSPPEIPHANPHVFVGGGAIHEGPELPYGDCEVRCEPASDCEGALRNITFPRYPLYTEQAARLAVFRSRADCRAFASARAQLSDES